MAVGSGRGGWAFVALPLTVLFLFSALPAAAGVGLSFFEFSSTGELRFVGLANYAAALSSDPMLFAALRNTLVFALCAVPVTVLGGFLLAVALHAPWFRARTLARTLLFLPTVISVVAIGYLWRWVLDSQAGLLDLALDATGLGALLFPDGAPMWLGDNPWVLGSLASIHVWRTIGFATILYLAALGRVPRSHYEAISLDGATPWQAIWHVTWPAVRPMTLFLLVTGFIGALQVFDLVWVMTEGSGTWSTVLNVQLYKEFSANRLGYAATIGVVLLVLSATVTWMQFRWHRVRGGGT